MILNALRIQTVCNVLLELWFVKKVLFGEQRIVEVFVDLLFDPVDEVEDLELIKRHTNLSTAGVENPGEGVLEVHETQRPCVDVLPKAEFWEELLPMDVEGDGITAFQMEEQSVLGDAGRINGEFHFFTFDGVKELVKPLYLHRLSA